LETSRPKVPQILNYQSRVAVDGVNFGGTGQFKFALVDKGTNTAETATTIAAITGNFVASVALSSVGSGCTNPPAITFSGGNESGAAATATGGC